MAVCTSLSLSVIYANSVPKLSSNPSQTRTKILMKLKAIASTPTKLYGRNSGKSRSPTKINAGLSAIEPDLNEDPVDRWRTNGVDPVPSPSTTSLFIFLCVCVCDSFWCFFFFLVEFIGGFWVWDIWWAPHVQRSRRNKRYVFGLFVCRSWNFNVEYAIGSFGSLQFLC